MKKSKIIQFPKDIVFVCPKCGYIIDLLSYRLLRVLPTCMCGIDMVDYERIEISK